MADLVLGLVVADGSLVPFFVVDIQKSRKDCWKLEKKFNAVSTVLDVSKAERDYFNIL